ncbi:pyridoxamine 5'-phosphate oxidase family protein [Arthrobacter sp. lap29]|uniref:pyridoxamine 5'-phosphate oxidase family protein n=1 Tax=Arthrobacter sp. lap29 TaxID=3056122 RepID=UPI0028F73FDE|nr:pyridoxamine 5'-phosphate oxidase family protein [Arthrobacter sp. lap29]
MTMKSNPAVTTPDSPAVVIEAHAEIFPVNYAVNNVSVIFRTAEGAKFPAVTSNSQVAFEIDGYEATTEQAWSVVLCGIGQELHHDSGLAEPTVPPLQPWQGGNKEHVVRINTVTLNGRRFPVPRADIWTTPLADTRRSTFE